MERQQWMEALLRLHYGQKFSRGAACKQLGVNPSTGYKFFQRFTQSGLTWPLPDEITAGELERIPMPSKPIDRSYAGPGLLARVLTAKYCDHQPLNRQSVIYGRQGVELSRSTMERWVDAMADIQSHRCG